MKEKESRRDERRESGLKRESVAYQRTEPLPPIHDTGGAATLTDKLVEEVAMWLQDGMWVG